MNKKPLKNQDSKKAPMSVKSQPSRKKNKKGKNPTRFRPITEPSALICKNSACRAVLSIYDTFCKRCSCYICHLFDDKKDPTLWLECAYDSPAGSCGASCHIRCALQRKKVGVVDLGQLMQLDGSYCCASCGKISEILGCWKKQLTIAKDSQNVNDLCNRIHLSFRLFDGTLRFQDLHQFVKDAKNKLETELGPLTEVFAMMARKVVRKLSVAEEVQALCDAAIQKADELSATLSSATLDGTEPFKFMFQEITASSVVLILIEPSTASSSDIIGFKLWYWKTTEETHTNEPISVFPRSQRRILISNLQPCTEYSFRVVPVTKTGDLGHSEAKCFTETMDNNPPDVTVPQNESTPGAKDVESASRFEVQDFGKYLQLGYVEDQGHLDDISGADLSQLGQMVGPDTSKAEGSPFVSHGLDLNFVTVLDLNKGIAPPTDTARDEADHASGGSDKWAQHGPNGQVQAVDSLAEVSRKRLASTEAHDSDSALISRFAAHKGGPSNLDENFEYCVKIIRRLECEGYIKQEFRLKLLTWFSLWSTEQERRVVNTFIQTLADDPTSLAGQLVDSFADIINNKTPRKNSAPNCGTREE